MAQGREVLPHWALCLHLRAFSFKGTVLKTFPCGPKSSPKLKPHRGLNGKKNQSGRKTWVSQEPSAEEDSREHHIIIMADSY